MDPFSGTLNRLGYLLWTAAANVFIIASLVIIDLAKKDSPNSVRHSWLYGVIVVFAGVIVLATVRRLQNAGRSPWWSLLLIVPWLDILFWLSLFFLPTKPWKS